LESKKIVAGPKPEPAKKGHVKLQPREVPFRGKHINQSGTSTWGRNLPGVKFGPWMCIYENGNVCDYERTGIAKDNSHVVQTHSNRVEHTKAGKPKVVVKDETIEIDSDAYRVPHVNQKSNVKNYFKNRLQEAQAAADKALFDQGWTYA